MVRTGWNLSRGSDELAAGHGGDLVTREIDDRDAVETGVDRSEEGGQRRRPICRCLADAVERDRVGLRERTSGGPAQRPEVRGAAEPLTEVARKGADVGAGGTDDIDDRDRALGLGIVPGDQCQRPR